MRLTRLLATNEVRRTADSDATRVGGQARPEHEVLPEDGDAWGWVETECLEVQVHESRRPALVLEGAEQESESP
jgi:hypothetical protein